MVQARSDLQALLRSVDAAGPNDNYRDVVMHLGPRLLNETRFEVFGRECQLAEVEVYYYSDRHTDIFANCHQVQSTFGSWYLHRMGSGLKNGTYKGLDFTFGNGETFGGVLIRSLRTPDGAVVSGPSLCVDYIMAAGEVESVHDLDRQIGQREIWDDENPVRLVPREKSDEAVYCSPRVGLTLGKLPVDDRKKQFILRPYRSLLAPREIKKGRVQLFLSLHLLGFEFEEISRITGSPLRKIQEYADFVEQGASHDIESLVGTLGSKELCLLAGALMNAWNE